MAITTGGELLSEIGKFMQRVDMTVQAPVCVHLAEAEMNRELRTPEMETVDASFSITGEYVTIPTGFLEVRAFYHNSTPNESLTPLGPDSQTGYMVDGLGKPVYYSIVGTTLRFAPVPDATYVATLVYYKAPTTVSSGAGATNWMLAQHPDMYLAGSMMWATKFAQDYQAAAGWDGEFKRAIMRAKRQGTKMRWPGPMQVRPG